MRESESRVSDYHSAFDYTLFVLQLRVRFAGKDATIQKINFDDSTGMGIAVKYPANAQAGTVTVELSNSINQQVSTTFVYEAGESPIKTSKCLQNCGAGPGFRALQGSAASFQLELDWPALVGWQRKDLTVMFDNSFGSVTSVTALPNSTELIIETPSMQNTEINGILEINAQLKIPTGDLVTFPFTYSTPLRPTAAYFDDQYSRMLVSFNIDAAITNTEFSCTTVIESSSIAKLGSSSEPPKCTWLSKKQLQISLTSGFEIKTGDRLSLIGLSSSDGLSSIQDPVEVAVYNSPTTPVRLIDLIHKPMLMLSLQDPVATITGSSIIGPCDSVTLDGSSSKSPGTILDLYPLFPDITSCM